MKLEVIPNEQTPVVPYFLPDMNENEMVENMKKIVAFKEYFGTRNDAVGLAANQCSIDGERFMVRLFALRDLKINEWKLIINPYITEYIGIKEIKCEGCLTWKDKVIVAERHRGVMVRYWDENAKEHHELHYGFEGQIWQHEINHLNGVEEEVFEFYPEPKPIEINRNDKCPCGSGRKYKQCCLLLI